MRIAESGMSIRKPPRNSHFRIPLIMPDDLHDEIKTMMVENLMLKIGKDQIGNDLPLFSPEGLGLDSIDALELVVSLEKKFGVTVPNSEVAKQALASVNALHDYVQANRKT